MEVADAVAGRGDAPATLRRPAQLDALTGLRFFAAFFILIEHATAWTSPFTDSDALRHYGGVPSVYAMTLFFVLSGFVIHYNYSKLFRTKRFRWAAGEFFGARVARLYPLFIVFFCVGLVVDATAGWLTNGHADWWFELVLRYATLTQSWFYTEIFGDRMLMSNAFGLAWSISTEMFFYVTYLGLVFLVLKLRRPGQAIIAAAIVALLVIAAVGAGIYFRSELGELAASYLPGYISAEQKWSESFIRWLFYYSPYARLPEFVMGCLAAQLYLLMEDRPVSNSEMRVTHRVLWGVLGLLFAMGALYASDLGGQAEVYYHFFALNFLTAVPVAVLIYCVARVPSLVSRLLAAAPLVALGDISYSIYVVHTWTLRIFIREPVPFSPAYGWDAVGRVGFGILLTLVLASATYRIIEVPGRGWLRGVTANLLQRLFGPADANKITPVALAWERRTAYAFLALLFAGCFVYQIKVGW